MKLSEDSLNWALKNLLLQKDGDVFPFPFEFEAIQSEWDYVIQALKQIDIEKYPWHEPKYLFVLKQEIRFRKAAQLDPIDSIILTSILKDIGPKIESRRVLVACKRVFSYRFIGDPDGQLYHSEATRQQFQKLLNWYVSKNNFVVKADIVDFYNQIYYHTLENQINECNFEDEYKIALKHFFGDYSPTSRGIPVGPHATHLLAELTLIPIDHSISLQKIQYCRYMDDFFLFCQTKEDALKTIYDLTSILDEHKLVLNQEKTKIIPCTNFLEQEQAEKPINKEEGDIIGFIFDNSVDPYNFVEKIKITPEIMEIFSESKITKILEAYLNKSSPNYPRIRWFLRRLSQTGVPSAINFIIKYLPKLFPALSEIVQYISVSSSNYKGDPSKLCEIVLEIIKSETASKIEYLRLMLIHSFRKLFNERQITQLIELFDMSMPSVKREIIIAASDAKAGDWLRKFKEGFHLSDIGLKRAILYAMRALPDDERTHWLQKVSKHPDLSILEKAIILNSLGDSPVKKAIKRSFVNPLHN